MNVAFISSNRDFAGKLSSLPIQPALVLQEIPLTQFDPALLKVHPDLIVIEVPAEDSEAALAAIQSLRCRDHLRKIPIVVFSPQPNRELIRTLQQAGIRDVLSSGIDPTVLRTRLEPYLSTSSLTQTVSSETSGKETEVKIWDEVSANAFHKQVRMEINARLEMLPSLPTVVAEILRLAQSSKSTAQDFEEHISKDQALAARILRMANAGFFALKTKVKSIHEAAVILGVRTLKSLVIASSASNLLDRPAEGYGYQGGGLWKHSMSCAFACQYLGIHYSLEEKEVDELFVQGLLHDIGKLLLSPFVTEKSREFRNAITQQNLSPLDAEHSILGVDHCSVGVDIAERWNLPEEVRHIIKYHHIPSGLLQLSAPLCIVHLANHMCHQLKIGMLPDTYIQPTLSPEVYQALEMTPEHLTEMEALLHTHLSENGQMIEVIQETPA